jgi:ribosomal-protein-alanine N-acetyltransferase
VHDDAPRLFTGRLELIATTVSGWGAWRVVVVAQESEVGTIELTAPSGGCVECHVRLETKWRRKGYATEAMGGLIDWAFSHAEVRRIAAQAPRQDADFIRVLEESGLSHAGDGDAPEMRRFELSRP